MDVIGRALVLGVLLGFAASAQAQTKCVPTTVHDDHMVWSAAVSTRVDRRQVWVVVAPHTQALDVGGWPTWPETTTIPESALASHARRNRRVVSLGDFKLAMRPQTVLLTEERSPLQWDGEGRDPWAWLTEHDRMDGIFLLSRPGYSCDAHHAVVVVDKRCGPDCRETIAVHVWKQQGVWRTQRTTLSPRFPPSWR
mgnify:CR=1 FL=1